MDRLLVVDNSSKLPTTLKGRRRLTVGFMKVLRSVKNLKLRCEPLRLRHSMLAISSNTICEKVPTYLDSLLIEYANVPAF